MTFKTVVLTLRVYEVYFGFSSVLVHSFLTSSLFRCIAFNFTYILIVSFESTQLM